MLDPDKLAKNIQNTLNTVIPEAFEQALLATQTTTTKKGSENAKEFAKVIDEAFSEEFANGLAFAIDAYVKNMEISATFMSTPCVPYTPLNFSLKHFGNRTVTNSIGTSGTGPTGQGAFTIK